MKLSDMRFIEKNAGSGLNLVLDKKMNALKSYLNEPEFFEIIRKFFFENHDNSESKEVVMLRLELDLEELELISDLDKNVINELKDLLIYVYTQSTQIFSDFRADYVEYLGFLYLIEKAKKIDSYKGQRSYFYNEPKILYKRKLLFGCQSLIDDVHINRTLEIVDFIECKINVQNFLSHVKTKATHKNSRNAKKKFAYMQDVNNLFKNKIKCTTQIYMLTLNKNSNTMKYYEEFKDDILFIFGDDMLNVLAS